MTRWSSSKGRLLASTVVFMGILVTAAPATAAAPKPAPCSRGKGCTGADSIAPTISISSPAPGSTVSGSVAVSGTASDNISVAQVDVQVDSGPLQRATGTVSWTASVATTAYSNGSHTITARVTDTAGNASTSSATVSVFNGGTSGGIRLSDPAATHGLALLGRGKMAENGTITGLLYWEEFTSRRAMFFRDSVSGATSYVSLPVDSLAGWVNATYALRGSDLWVWGGGGPVYLRRYQLSGSPLPTSAVLVSTQGFGDADSRRGDMTILASGGLVAVWNQQGEAGPQGLGIAYRSPAGAWQAPFYPVYFMPTMASKQVVAQHPADASVWVFNIPDAWGEIGAAHLTEGPSGLALDWTDGSYIMDQKHGDFAPDPERADLALAADPSSGTLVLAYQSRVRRMFATNPVVTGSHIAIARIGAAGPTSFLMLPTYVERISALGLVVRPGEISMAYRPIDEATLTFDKLYVSVNRRGAWTSPTILGTLAEAYGLVGSGISRAEFSAEMADGALHLFIPA